jgi:hypothetical protein
VFALLVLSFAVIVHAQQAGSAAIQGRVLDSTGAAVPGASITLKNAATGATRMMESDAGGNYRAELLPPGIYELTVMRTGFRNIESHRAEPAGWASATVNLEVPVANLNEVVTVVGEAPLANPEKIGVNDTISQTQVENLPINGRRWDNFVLLTPGVAGDGTFGLISSRGISGLLNNNTVDGVDNNRRSLQARGPHAGAYSYNQERSRNSGRVEQFLGGIRPSCRRNGECHFSRARTGHTASSTTSVMTRNGRGSLLFGNKPEGSTSPRGRAEEQVGVSNTGLAAR